MAQPATRKGCWRVEPGGGAATATGGGRDARRLDGGPRVFGGVGPEVDDIDAGAGGGGAVDGPAGDPEGLLEGGAGGGGSHRHGWGARRAAPRRRSPGLRRGRPRGGRHRRRCRRRRRGRWPSRRPRRAAGGWSRGGGQPPPRVGGETRGA